MAATPRNRRELVLDHGQIFIEVPRLMTDHELADVLAAFVETVRAPACEAIDQARRTAAVDVASVPQAQASTIGD